MPRSSTARSSRSHASASPLHGCLAVRPLVPRALTLRLGVDDPVGVALLGEEPLPVLGEVGVDGVARDDRVEVRGRARPPWGAAAGRAAGPPPGASRTIPDTWIATAAAGRSMEKLATLRDHEQVDLAGAERLEEPLPLLDRGLALDHRRVEVPRRARRAGRGTARSPASARPGAARRAARRRRVLAWVHDGEPVALLGLGGRVDEPLGRSAGSPAPRRSRPGAIQPCASMSFHGASYRLGPIRENTSPSRPSSRTSVAVSPSRRRACRSAVIRKIGAGSRCTSS